MNRQKTNADQQLTMDFLPIGFMIEDIIEPVQDALKPWVEAYNADKYSALYHMGFLGKETWFSSSAEFLHHIAEMLIKKLSQTPDIELSRGAVQVFLLETEREQLKECLPFVIGMEFVDDQWITSLLFNLLKVFQREISDFDGSVARYFAEYDSKINVVGRVYFHLVENKDDLFPFAFMATYSTKSVKSRKAIHTPLRHALREFDGDERKLLALISSVVKAAEQSSFISGLLNSGELFSPIKLTVEEAFTLLNEVGLYEEAGIMCRVPDWWRKKRVVQLTVKVGQKEPSKVGLDALLDFDPELTIGEESVSQLELMSFLDMADGLIRFRGEWVVVDKEKIQAALNALEKMKNRSNRHGMTLRDALRMELQNHQGLKMENDQVDISISNGQWLKMMTDTLIRPSLVGVVAVPQTIKATLRAYQVVGYHWLFQMSQYGLGACLADDMGLGKTIQMIAFLEYIRLNALGQALLILPASLIGNWEKEIERFAPEMTYKTFHKSATKDSEMCNVSSDVLLTITTYGMALRLSALSQKTWDFVILDEAQAIRNAGSKQTKAIKAIPAKMRIAMTGTPIENRLSDLWSLFDFLNPGLLGTSKEFSVFAKGLTDNAIGYAKLRKMIRPFLLRRLKTDKTIISDLPDKVEIEVLTSLTKRQIVLYQQLMGQISEKLNEAEGIQRKGLVLSSITKFKQICNHPDQYLGKDEFKPEHSGKFEQLRELCDIIAEKRERVIIFTQFREMTEPISHFLKELFHKEGFVLHGGTPVKKRTEMVEQFNGEHYIPYMVLSLKAGGVGLNLTAANHVIHFDRWWNPAVENQATDRAFRIGQTKQVMVHKLISKGTIEEKISTILEGKRKLSADILSQQSEQWITELSNQELMALFTLGEDNV